MLGSDWDSTDACMGSCGYGEEGGRAGFMGSGGAPDHPGDRCVGSCRVGRRDGWDLGCGACGINNKARVS